MHFGHYAMEVFDAMYRDARDWGHLCIEDREIPTVILENNLFGIDIDRRAVQLAALSLFMKARTMHPEASVQQVNLVAADATLPDSDVRERFLERYARTPRVQDAFAQVLDDMDQVAELGSLLRVEERLRELLSDVGHVAGKEALKALDPRRQRDLPGMEPPVRQMGLADLADDDEQAAAWTPQYTLRELREDLRAFARRALDEHDLNAQLFATEADKAVRLLDVLMADYDVVVMNPPYGNFYNTTTYEWEYIKSQCPLSDMNVLCAFIERSLRGFARHGYVGAIVDRGFMVKSRYEKFRRTVLLEKVTIETLADVGWEVLYDAQVETAAVVLNSAQKRLASESVFLRANSGPARTELLHLLEALDSSSLPRNVYLLDQMAFRDLPNTAFSYWLPNSVLRSFRNPSMEPAVAFFRVGIHPGNATKFFRYRWEVPSSTLETDWLPLANGGPYRPFYRDYEQVIYYANDGEKVKSEPGAIVANEDSVDPDLDR